MRGEALLDVEGGAHRLDHAAEFDDRAVARALDEPAAMARDGRIDEVGPQRSQPRDRALFVLAGQPAVADDVGDHNRREFPGLAHPSPLSRPASEPRARRIFDSGILPAKLQVLPQPKHHPDQRDESSAHHLAVTLKRAETQPLQASRRIDAE